MNATAKLCLLLALCLLISPLALADKLEGDEAKAAKERLRDVKKDWKKATKAQKLPLLVELGRLPENSVGDFLQEVISDDADDDVALFAAKALTRHNDPADAKALVKLYNKAKTPGRRAACVRWLGLYGDAAPLSEIKKLAQGDDGSAEAATHALADVNTKDAWLSVETVALMGKNAAARRAACGRLLKAGDSRGAEALDDLGNLEDASAAAHWAIGTDMETEAIKKVLTLAGAAFRLGKASERPHYFGSLLARLTRQESHDAVAAAAGSISPALDVEFGWWLVSVSRAQPTFGAASRWLGSDKLENVVNGLRLLQRAPKPFEGEQLSKAGEALLPLLTHEDDMVCQHALLTCAATGACREKLAARVAEWIEQKDKHEHRAAALLAAGMAGLKEHAPRALDALKEGAFGNWFVQSAALDCLLRLRPADCVFAVLEYARLVAEGRLFAEAICLLVDMTGKDFGDELDKWEAHLKANASLEVPPRKRETLRGVPYTRMKQKTASTFFGIEIESTNVHFALDHSVSMVNPVSREPARSDFDRRRDDVLKRRPEVNRMVRDGFLPRYYVATCELNAALDGMSQKAKFGITLFNHEMEHYLQGGRVVNSNEDRQKAVNWMLSGAIQGGTDIQQALLWTINKGEADTILLLTDGEPTSLGILEQISRANVVKRVNILVVSTHQKLYYRHYMHAMASRDGGKITDAEPRE